jgi:hypothetical protein
MTGLKIGQISKDWLLQAKISLEEGASMKAVCRNVPWDSSSLTTSISRQSLVIAFRLHDIEFPVVKKGRPCIPVPIPLADGIQKMRTNHIKVGVVKTYQRLAQDFTLNEIQKQNDSDSKPTKYQSQRPPNPPDHFFPLTDSEDSMDGSHTDIPQGGEDRKAVFSEKSDTEDGFGYLSGIERIPSKYMVFKVFKELGILKFTRKPNEWEIPRCTYEASSTNLIWHADVHFMSSDQKIKVYAIIDD